MSADDVSVSFEGPSASYVAMLHLPTAVAEELLRATSPPPVTVVFGTDDEDNSIRIGDESFSFSRQSETQSELFVQEHGSSTMRFSGCVQERLTVRQGRDSAAAARERLRQATARAEQVHDSRQIVREDVRTEGPPAKRARGAESHSLAKRAIGNASTRVKAGGTSSGQPLHTPTLRTQRSLEKSSASKTASLPRPSIASLASAKTTRVGSRRTSFAPSGAASTAERSSTAMASSSVALSANRRDGRDEGLERWCIQLLALGPQSASSIHRRLVAAHHSRELGSRPSETAVQQALSVVAEAIGNGAHKHELLLRLPPNAHAHTDTRPTTNRR